MILRHEFLPLDNTRLAHLCGSMDGHLRDIESVLHVSISRRNEFFRVEGAKLAAERAMGLLQALYEHADEPIPHEDFQLALMAAERGQPPKPRDDAGELNDALRPCAPRHGLDRPARSAQAVSARHGMDARETAALIRAALRLMLWLGVAGGVVQAEAVEQSGGQGLVGQAAFDKKNDKLFLNDIPFSDMASLCDPSTPDIAGRVLEVHVVVGDDEVRVAIADLGSADAGAF